MARRKMWVVRIHLRPDDIGLKGQLYRACNHGFLEQLRYAGLVRWVNPHNEEITFDLKAPIGFAIGDTEGWAKSNAARMRSFGYDATPVKIER